MVQNCSKCENEPCFILVIYRQFAKCVLRRLSLSDYIDQARISTNVLKTWHASEFFEFQGQAIDQPVKIWVDTIETWRSLFSNPLENVLTLSRNFRHFRVFVCFLSCLIRRGSPKCNLRDAEKCTKCVKVRNKTSSLFVKSLQLR